MKHVSKSGLDLRNHDQQRSNMESIKQTPIKAIRNRCIDCSAGSLVEVRLCPVTTCPIWPYRMGRRPTMSSNLSQVTLLDEQIMRENPEDLKHSTPGERKC